MLCHNGNCMIIGIMYDVAIMACSIMYHIKYVYQWAGRWGMGQNGIDGTPALVLLLFR